MTRTRRESPVGALSRITDREAARTVSEPTLSALLDAVVTIPVPLPRESRRARPRRWRLVLAAGLAAATLVAVTGAISGRSLTVAQPADAEILRGVAAALHPAVSVVIESFTRVTPCRGAGCGPARQGDGPYRIVEETAHGALQRELILAEPGIRSGVEVAIAPGGANIYDPGSGTVYRFSSYGHDLMPGPSLGTEVYRLPAQTTLLHDEGVPGSEAPVPPDGGTVPRQTLTVTAGQARALRDGRARIDLVAVSPGHYAMRVAPAWTIPAMTPREQARLLMGPLRVLGPAVVDGQRAIRLVPIHGQGELDVRPGTYYPIKEILAGNTTYTWQRYEVHAASQPNVSLLSVTARHPSARLEDSNAGFLTAWHRLAYGD